MIKWWAIKGPNGRLISSTIAPTKDECWDYGYLALAHYEGADWEAEFWKRRDASIASAKALGYKFVRVEIREVKRSTGDRG